MGDITGKDWDLAVKMEMVLRADKAANPSGSSSGDDLHDSEEVQAHKLPGVDYGDMFFAKLGNLLSVLCSKGFP